MADPARIASLTAALAEELAANTVTVTWRTLAAEAAARGFPSSRAFREWCQRTGVTIREAGGVALVAVAEVDAVLDRATARPVPVSVRGVSVVTDEIDSELRGRTPSRR